MWKKFLLINISFVIASDAFAQEVFWGYDQNNNELIIPMECDGVQTPKELYDNGMQLLSETGYARRGASYCLLASAQANYPQAQYQVAHMYHKGILLPKSELAAYKWATIGALNGNADADKLGATLEQFLSIQDIELTTSAVETMFPQIKQSITEQLTKEHDKQEKIAQNIQMLDQQIKDLQNFGYITELTLQMNPTSQQPQKQDELSDTSLSFSVEFKPTRKDKTLRATANESIYSPQDLADIPMPSAL